MTAFTQLRKYAGTSTSKAKPATKSKLKSGQRFESRKDTVFLPEADLINAERFVWQLALAKFPYCETARGVDCLSGMTTLGKNWNSIDSRERDEVLMDLSRNQEFQSDEPVDWSSIAASRKLVLFPTLMTDTERKALVKHLPTLKKSPELRGQMTEESRLAFYLAYLTSDLPPALEYRLPIFCNQHDARSFHLKRCEYLTKVRQNWPEWTNAAGVTCRDASGLPTASYLGTNWISISDAKKLVDYFNLKWVVSAEEFDPQIAGWRGHTEQELIRHSICVKLQLAGLPVPVRVKGDDFTYEERKLFADIRKLLPSSEVEILYGLSRESIEKHWQKACRILEGVKPTDKAAAPTRKRGQLNNS